MVNMICISFHGKHDFIDCTMSQRDNWRFDPNEQAEDDFLDRAQGGLSISDGLNAGNVRSILRKCLRNVSDLINRNVL